MKLAQYWAEKGLPAGLGVDIRCRIQEVTAVPLLEAQLAHVIGDRYLGCIGDPGCPLGALHAAWPPIRAVPVIDGQPGDNLRNQIVCAERPCGAQWIRAVSARLWCSSWWIRSKGCKGEAFKGVLGREMSDVDGDKDVFLRECRHHSETGGRGVVDRSGPSSGTTVAKETRDSLTVDKVRASELEDE